MTGDPAAQQSQSFEDYLEAEQRSEVKHEWLDGLVYAMAASNTGVWPRT